MTEGLRPESQALKLPEYEMLLRSMEVWAIGPALNIANQIKANKSKYMAVSVASGCPWEWIAAIHWLECSGNFEQHLANGDPISGPTIHVPAGIPAGTWEECAIAALALPGKGYRKNNPLDWADFRKWLWRAEEWNGWGYTLKPERGYTPYLWSGTKPHYKKGKFVADGRFDPEAVSQQVGCVPIWVALGVMPYGEKVVKNGGNKVAEEFDLKKVFQYYKALPHQMEAVDVLQRNLTAEQTEAFLKVWRSAPAEEDKTDVYTARFRMALRKTSDLLEGTFEFLKNGEQYNLISCTSSLPGRQFAGSWNDKGGLLPPTELVQKKTGKDYRIKTTPISMPNVSGVAGNFYPIEPFELDTDGANRGDWGCHFDAGVPGSLGCLVYRTRAGWQAVQREFAVLEKLGIRAIDLIVEYQ